VIDGFEFKGGAKAVLPCRGLPLPQATNGAPRLLAAPAGSASGLASSGFSLRQNARYSPLYDSPALALLNLCAKSGKNNDALKYSRTRRAEVQQPGAGSALRGRVRAMDGPRRSAQG
jgi:hypothetical protein